MREYILEQSQARLPYGSFSMLVRMVKNWRARRQLRQLGKERALEEHRTAGATFPCGDDDATMRRGIPPCRHQRAQQPGGHGAVVEHIGGAGEHEAVG